MNKPKTNKDRIRDCIIKQGVEHLACYYKPKKHTVIVHISRDTTKSKIDTVGFSLLRMRSVKIAGVTIVTKDRYYFFEKGKQVIEAFKR